MFVVMEARVKKKFSLDWSARFQNDRQGENIRILPDVLFQANFDIQFQLFTGTLFTINTF
jgi:hypothetical protein